MANFQMKTSGAMIDKMIESSIARRETAIINVMKYVGEACINEARTGKTYKDRSGNLRSSIGYVIVKDGQIIDSVVSSGTKEGASAGREFSKELADKSKKGLVLIVSAGMNYAQYVEAMGLNVLTSAELKGRKLLPRLMKQLGFEVK